MSDDEQIAYYRARAVAIAALVDEYEESHGPGVPCFEAALRAVKEAMEGFDAA